MNDDFGNDSLQNGCGEQGAAIYDADAPEQRVGLTLTSTGRDGRPRRHRVAHIFRPLTDELYFKFDEMRRVTQTISGTGLVSVATEDRSLRAVAWLWDQLAIRREGYVDRPDWRDRTNLIDKQTAVEKGLLTVFPIRGEFSPDGAAPGATFAVNDGDERAPDPFLDEDGDFADGGDYDDDVQSTVRLDCIFNETPMSVAHTFQPPSAADFENYEVLQKNWKNLIDTRRGFRQKRGEQFAQLAIQSRSRELCRLYDRLIVSTDGYASRVPAHHKTAAVAELFAREAEVTEKN